jgi:transposase
MTQKRKRLSGPEKIAIVKRYLVERVPISDLCDEYGLQPSQIYRWQAAIFEHGADVFDLKKGRHAKAVESAKDARIAKLEEAGCPRRSDRSRRPHRRRGSSPR